MTYLDSMTGLNNLTEPQPFPQKLRNWRRLQLMKQETLATLLGVTQAAVSRWENGLDEPSPYLRSRLRNLMASRTHDDLEVERLLLERLPGRRVLFDLDGCRLVAISPEVEKMWPGYKRLMGRMLQDHTIGEMRQILDDSEMLRDIRHRQVALISGVSMENLRFQREVVKHRWHIGFRQSGSRLIGDFIYQDAEEDDVVGIHDIIRIDTI